MTELNADYWSNRYSTDDFPWDIGYVATPLKEYFDQLTNKELKILIPGAGNSYEAEYLFKNGFKNVFVLDFAQLPLDNIKKRIPDFPSENLICQDFFSHNGKYDLIIEQTFFCALNPSLRTKYVQKMKDLLLPDGKLVGLLFNDPLNTDKPPFGGNMEEYKAIFESIFRFKTFEIAKNSVPARQGRELFINIMIK